ncbi:hypothetical protein [Actinosynnema sp. NPDC023926]|uniref:hypothetical protein n=1 Tax=Actinosynnema sp. NPDC023926 TaxID=3157196 RepID=UPI0033ECD055
MAASTVVVVGAVVLGLNAERQAVAPPAEDRPPTVKVDQHTSMVVSGTSSAAVTGSGAPSVTATAPVDTSSVPGLPGPTTTTTVADPAAEPLVPVVPDRFAMTTGGPPVELPVTIRNTGSTPVEPATLVLSLPEGVHVVGPGDNLRRGPRVGFDGAARQSVGCPAGKGTVTCTAEAELPAGGSVTFVFRLLAGPKAVGGTISGTVTAGAGRPVPVVVTVVVTPK